MYQETQAKLWPELVAAAVLAPPSYDIAASLADAYLRRFLNGAVEEFVVQGSDTRPWTSLGTSYVRYSSSQQNPRSLDDQLVLQLGRARADRVFIPWQYVFADAGVTGTITARVGYNLAKQALALEGAGAVEVLYVDEIARATRDGIETLLLGHYVQTRGKRMIGVSDGFDSADQFSKMKLHFFAMFNEQFMDQHRQKVLRGKAGAARRGTILGRCPIGLKPVPAVDGNGVPLRVRSGNQANTFGIDEEGRTIVEYAVKRFVDDRCSLYQIARELNRMRRGGRVSWTGTTVGKMLSNRLYVGIYVYHRVRHVKDPLTGKQGLVIRPRSEWKVKRFRHAQIITWARWKQIRARLREVAVASPYKRKRGEVSRNTAYPKTLLSGLIYCGYCGSELKLYRSNGDRKQFYCLKGKNVRDGCKLLTSKSTRLLENSCLNFLRANVLTPDRVRQAVDTANAVIREEAARPRSDVRPFQRAAADLKRKRERLIELVADESGPDLASVRHRIAAIERELRDVNEQIRHAEAAAVRIVPPLDEQRAASLLADLRQLLNQDVALAAPVLRRLFGRIHVRNAVEEPTETASRRSGDRRRPAMDWIATAQLQMLPALADVALARPECPDSVTWVNLKDRIWTQVAAESFLIQDNESMHKRVGTAMTDLVDGGMSIAEAARSLGVRDHTGRLGYHWYRTTASARDGLENHRKGNVFTA